MGLIKDIRDIEPIDIESPELLDIVEELRECLWGEINNRLNEEILANILRNEHISKTTVG